MPGLPPLHIVKVEACALVVRRVQPEHAGEHFLCISQPAKAPQTQAITVETPEERTIVNAPPGKETVKVLAEGELSDFDSHIIMAGCHIRVADKSEVSQMRMGIETAEQ